MGDQRDLFFYAINENPVELRLCGWGSNLTQSAVELMGVEEGNITSIRTRNNMTYASKSVSVWHHCVATKQPRKDQPVVEVKCLKCHRKEEIQKQTGSCRVYQRRSSRNEITG